MIRPLSFIPIAVKTVLALLKLWVKLRKVVGRIRDWNTSHILKGKETYYHGEGYKEAVRDSRKDCVSGQGGARAGSSKGG